MTNGPPTIVLVHGAWADATGFDPEIRALREHGFTVIGHDRLGPEVAPDGVTVVPSVAAVAARSSVVVLSLPDGAATTTGKPLRGLTDRSPRSPRRRSARRSSRD